MPVRPCSEDDAERNPARIQSGHIRKSRHPHQHPARHIGRLGAHGGHPCAKLTVTEEIVAHVARPPIIIHPDAHHQEHIDEENNTYLYSIRQEQRPLQSIQQYVAHYTRFFIEKQNVFRISSFTYVGQQFIAPSANRLRCASVRLAITFSTRVFT